MRVPSRVIVVVSTPSWRFLLSIAPRLASIFCESGSESPGNGSSR